MRRVASIFVVVAVAVAVTALPVQATGGRPGGGHHGSSACDRIGLPDARQLTLAWLRRSASADGITLTLDPGGTSVSWSAEPGVIVHAIVVKSLTGTKKYLPTIAATGLKPPGFLWFDLWVLKADVCYSVTPAPVVPEAPLALLLPLAGALGVAGFVVLHRRRAHVALP